MDTTRQAYKQKMEAQLSEWAAKVDVLKARAAGVAADARIEILSQLDELKAIELAAKARLLEVEAAADEKWHELRGGIERGWDQLSGSVEALWTRVSAKAKAKPGPDSASPR